ncbi:hypothetical protein BC938DRAFT_474490 [Jimgerdemannia flammicorona]|uniref:Uncharacterized protein n=1 Tax=Jimgerdemannia flammicorona TaxID=994334 RepID=A0A433Q287_9FUNG|nr:hypothetical protein BC938DRAFT_474490 [Jimgerdemannia flammicorona]
MHPSIHPSIHPSTSILHPRESRRGFVAASDYYWRWCMFKESHRGLPLVIYQITPIQSKNTRSGIGCN